MTSKHIVLACFKYLPSILALTCSSKILLLNLASKRDVFGYATSWVNLALNVFMLLFAYLLGRYFRFCWKHASLCRITAWGYAFYAVFLITQTPNAQVRELTAGYMVFVIIVTLTYASKCLDSE